KIFFRRVKCQRLHQTLAAFTFMRLIKLLAVTPGKSLPTLHTVAGHWIAHRSHATKINFFATRIERHRENPAEVMVALDDSPTREIRRGPLSDHSRASQFPHPHLAH